MRSADWHSHAPRNAALEEGTLLRLDARLSLAGKAQLAAALRKLEASKTDAALLHAPKETAARVHQLRQGPSPLDPLHDRMAAREHRTWWSLSEKRRGVSRHTGAPFRFLDTELLITQGRRCGVQNRSSPVGPAGQAPHVSRCSRSRHMTTVCGWDDSPDEVGGWWSGFGTDNGSDQWHGPAGSNQTRFKMWETSFLPWKQ